MEINMFDVIIQILLLVVSVVTCIYTILIHKKSYNILDVIESERLKKWNQNELERFFDNFPFDSLESFISSPTTIRDDLWRMMCRLDIDEYNGPQKDLIKKFIVELDSFCHFHYKPTPSRHWRFMPCDGNIYNADKEKEELKLLNKKVAQLSSLYSEIKKNLAQYQIDLRKINLNARIYYDETIKEELTI